MTAKVLLRGIIDTDGKTKSRPVIVTLNPETNEVIDYEFLEGHEPHSTTFDPAHLLRLPDKTLTE